VNSSAVKLGNRRVTGHERYYTPPALALELTRDLLELIPGFSARIVIEPAGGTGSFIDAALALGVTDIYSVDTEPLHPLVKRRDFLSWKPKLPARELGAVALSNPPFGRNNALSIPFFNHAAGFSEYQAYILPRSWRKWSVQNRLDRNFHLIADRDLELNYVDAEGVALSRQNRLRTCFQVWQRLPSTRPIIKVADLGFVSRATPQTADLAITTFGYGCGRVHREFDRAKNTTRIYLRVHDPRVYEVIDSLDYLQFSKHTAYTEALALSEIHYLLNTALTGEPHLEKVG
jgi:predicted RNA methylase